VLSGADVVFTDVYALDQLKQNIEANVPADMLRRATVAHYSWYCVRLHLLRVETCHLPPTPSISLSRGTDVSTMGDVGSGRWDMILGSDVVYDYRFMRPLIKAYTPLGHVNHHFEALPRPRVPAGCTCWPMTTQRSCCPSNATTTRALRSLRRPSENSPL
jgi:hypothetical protein